MHERLKQALIDSMNFTLPTHSMSHADGLNHKVVAV